MTTYKWFFLFLSAALPVPVLFAQQDVWLTYSTYLNGTGSSIINDATIDAQGFVYVIGSTSSPDFPTAHALQPFSGSRDIFVTKLSPDGSQIVFSTFIGSGQGAGDSGNGIRVDGSGNVFLTGYYTTPGLLGDAHNAFIAKLNPDGSFAGAVSISSAGIYADERPAALALDAQGNVYMAGTTYTNTIPIANGFQPDYHGSSTGFLVAVDASLTNLLYSTYLGSWTLSMMELGS